MVKKNKVKKKIPKTKIKIKKKALIFLGAIIILIVACIFGIRYINITLKYKEYTDKMYTYGLAQLYNNQKANATQKVTNEEMLRVVLAAINGNKDIDSINYYFNVEEQYKWLKYAKDFGFTDKITKTNLTDRASKKELTLVATRALEAIKGVTANNIELKMSKSKLNRLTEEEKNTISKAVALDIVENKNETISEDYIIKGELNKLVVTIVEKYATIYYKSAVNVEDETVENSKVNLVTDVTKMPTNYKEYPYIVDNISNDIYEADFKIITKRNSQTPKKAYEYLGDLYGQIDELLVKHFNTILNVDYTTITTENFLDNLQGTVVYKLTEDDVKDYVNYVKKNKIKLSGEAEPLLPIIYNNGEQYVVRTKVTFKVLSSNTDYNLLFGDETEKIKYTADEITMYVDVPMGMTLNSWSQRVHVTTFAKHLTTNNENITIEK